MEFFSHSVHFYFFLRVFSSHNRHHSPVEGWHPLGGVALHGQGTVLEAPHGVDPALLGAVHKAAVYPRGHGVLLLSRHVGALTSLGVISTKRTKNTVKAKKSRKIIRKSKELLKYSKNLNEFQQIFANLFNLRKRL